MVSNTAPHMPIWLVEERVMQMQPQRKSTSNAHQQQRGDERRFAADAIAIVPEDGGAHRSGRESDGVNSECLQRSQRGI